MSESGPSIYIVDDDLSVREAVAGLVRTAGLRAETFSSAREFLARPRPDVPSCLVLDVNLPGMTGLDLQQELTKADLPIPIIFLTGRGDIPMSVRAMKAGALEFLTKPVDEECLLESIRRGLAWDRRVRRPPSGVTHGFEGVAGTSGALATVLHQVELVAPTESTVLIRGESGTGKELIARAIHRHSQRSARPLVSFNCAATPPALITSELFGHEKGAFTGALQRRVGRFEMAAGGTLFLDEVGELPAETQIALLRVLQEREFERVGGNTRVRADVRIVAATNRDLEEAIIAGTFRSDLYYRLNVFPIEVPPLRDRKEDVRELSEYFLDRYARRAGKTIRSISDETLAFLEEYPWPGNVRELQNVIERSVILCESEVFSIDEKWRRREASRLEPAVQSRSPFDDDPPIASHSGPMGLPNGVTLDEIEREAILAALRSTSWVVGGPKGAAALLGLKRTTLQARIQRHGIPTARTAIADAARFVANGADPDRQLTEDVVEHERSGELHPRH